MLAARHGLATRTASDMHAALPAEVQETSAEIERLTAELTAVLRREPRTMSPARGRHAAKDGLSYEAPGLPDSAIEPASEQFLWQALQAEPAREAPGAGHEAILQDGAVPANTLEWLQKARRERRWKAAQRAGAWAVTVAVGTSLVAAAAYVITGAWPDFSGVLSGAFSRLL